VSLCTYCLFLIDSKRQTFWEQLDDYIYYIKAFGNSVEFCFGIFLFFNGAWILIFESGKFLVCYCSTTHTHKLTHSLTGGRTFMSTLLLSINRSIVSLTWKSQCHSPAIANFFVGGNERVALRFNFLGKKHQLHAHNNSYNNCISPSPPHTSLSLHNFIIFCDFKFLLVF